MRWEEKITLTVIFILRILLFNLPPSSPIASHFALSLHTNSSQMTKILRSVFPSTLVGAKISSWNPKTWSPIWSDPKSPNLGPWKSWLCWKKCSQSVAEAFLGRPLFLPPLFSPSASLQLFTLKRSLRITSRRKFLTGTQVEFQFC